MKRVSRAVLTFFGALSINQVHAGQDWSGPYLGGTLSFSKAETTVAGNRFTYNQNQALNLVKHDYQGGAINGVAGWNWQHGDFVLGGEISLGISNLSSNLVFNSDDDIDQVEIDWSGTIVGRLGYAFRSSLIYAKAGLAFSNIRNVGGDVNGGVLTLSDAHTREEVTFGSTIGVGWEQFVADNWLIRAEVSQSDYRSYSQANQDGAPGSQVYHVDNGPLRTFGIGLLYKF